MIHATEVRIPVGNREHVLGSLVSGSTSNGLIIFAHGSGSGGHSSRNQYLSKLFSNQGLSILLLDLLTRSEQNVDIRSEKLLAEMPGVILNKFNVKLLTKRLLTITRWAIEFPDTKDMELGYFGASTGQPPLLRSHHKKK
jgi:hypothetical protein